MREGAKCRGGPWLQMKGGGGGVFIVLAVRETNPIEYELPMI